LRLSAMTSQNVVYSKLSARRRYEVWFLRLGLADHSGAWWFRYLLMNPGHGGCPGHLLGRPVQVWASWFPRDGSPQSFIQGFSPDGLRLSGRGESPFLFEIQDNTIQENSCRGKLNVDGHDVRWSLRYRSTFSVVVSDKGWFGFVRTAHSDGAFAGEVSLDGRVFQGDPLGFGLQGHNCGYRHRGFWRWAHAYFPRPGKNATTLEALAYDMPFGLVFRRAVLWHEGRATICHKVRETALDSKTLQWNLQCTARDGTTVEAAIDGRGTGIHRLPYLKTDCSAAFEVANNSLAAATIQVQRPGEALEKLATDSGAVVEMAISGKAG